MTGHASSPSPVVLILGIGATGRSVARYLNRLGQPFAFADERADAARVQAVSEEFPGAALRIGRFKGSQLKRHGTVMVSPGIPSSHPALLAAAEAGVELVNDIELFARATNRPLIAITGSNGKSTVTSLVAHLLNQAGHAALAGGNLGPPALDLLAQPEPELYVLELSSFQLERCESLAPAAAAILNLSSDHLDRYADMAQYALAKARIYTRARVRIANGGDEGTLALAGPEAVRFGLELPLRPGDVGCIRHEGADWLAWNRAGVVVPLRPLAGLPLAGAHNHANMAAALALVAAVGVSPEIVCPGLGSFTGLPHRMQRVAEAGGVSWYDDSKATNVGATAAALAGLPGRVVLIAGGEGKGQDFRPLRTLLAEKARAVLLIGRDAPLLAEAWRDAALLEEVETLERAVERAQILAQPGDSVLLAPACASLDQFRDYRHRGERFAELARQITADAKRAAGRENRI